MSAFAPVQPLILDLEITNACPADCPMCPRDKLPSLGLMSEKTFTSVLKFVESSKNKLNIFICGIGEPLLHPKLFEYIRLFKESAAKPKLSITTAGERLTPEVFEKLKSLELDEIILSFQALDKNLYSKLMPGLKYDKVLENIEYISENQNSKLTFTISLTVHKMNEFDVENILKFARDKKLNIKVNNVHTRGGNMLDSDLTDTPPVNNNPLTSCNIFEAITFISWTGDIYPCAQDIERLNIMGNVMVDTMDNITLKKTDILKNGLKYKICSLCNDEIRLSLLSDKKPDAEQQLKNDQKLKTWLSEKIGILGENFLSNLVYYKTPDELLIHTDRILNDVSQTLKILAYLRKRYPKFALEINPLEKHQLIDEKILAGMNLNKESLTLEQLDEIYSYLINKYGFFLENIFNQILLMPKQQFISMIYKHFTDVNQFINKDLNLMFLWKEAMVKKQVPIYFE